MSAMNTPRVSLVSGLIGLLVGVIVTLVGVLAQSHVEYGSDQLAVKRDVLRRFAGNRYVMGENGLGVQPNGEPFVALNEAFVVFAGDSEVIEALQNMHAELGRPNRLVDNIVTLIKEMAAAADVSIDLNDSFIEHPFAPSTR